MTSLFKSDVSDFGACSIARPGLSHPVKPFGGDRTHTSLQSSLLNIIDVDFVESNFNPARGSIEYSLREGDMLSRFGFSRRELGGKPSLCLHHACFAGTQSSLLLHPKHRCSSGHQNG